METPVNKTNLPLHTNVYLASQKEKRKTISQKSERAIESGNIQDVIDSLTGKMKLFCEEYLVDLN
jgi:hypothetical protein